MILQDHLIKGSGKFVEGNSSLYITTLPKLTAIGIVLIYIYNYFSFSRDLKRPRDYMIM